MYLIPATPRPRWEDLPSSVHRHVAALLGSDVTAAGRVTTGFGNGFAGSLSLADGRRVFAKIAAESVNTFATNAHRAEIVVTGQIPAAAPVPALITAFDLELVGDPTGSSAEPDVWVGLVTEYVDGRSPDPRRPGDLDRVVDLTTELARFDPSPVPGLPRRRDDDATFGRWSRTDDDAPGLASYGPDLTIQLDRIRAAAADWVPAMDGTALLHGDLRLDNIVTTDERAYGVDWPAACTGAAWADTLLMIPALALVDGAPDPAAFLAGHPLLTDVDPAAIDTVLASALGYFVTSSLQPPPPGLPTIRAFQRAQAEVALQWLRQRWKLR